jgi:hypothetical protein
MLAAWLESEFGYKRHEIGNLTRGYIFRVLLWPRDSDGRLCPPENSEASPMSRVRQLREIFFRRGVPEHLINEKVAEAIKAESVRVRTAEPKPRPAPRRPYKPRQSPAGRGRR